MRHARATIRALAFGTLTGLVYVLWVAVSAITWERTLPACQACVERPVKGQRRDLQLQHAGSVRSQGVRSQGVRSQIKWRNFLFRTWARATAAMMGMRIKVSGTPPQAPFFLVSNHLSYIDIVVFASLLDCVFIAKQDVASWPVMGALCRSFNTIFIDRNNRHDIARVNALIEQTLAEGQSVMLFAEGTSTQGASVLPFKASLLEPAARASYPVSYAAVSYRTTINQPPAHLSVCWWGEMTFLDHPSAQTGSGVDCTAR